MVKIDRNEYQGGIETAIHRIKFCLDSIEDSPHFAKGIDWGTYIMEGNRLSGQPTIEELIGALVAAEQVLKEVVAMELI